MFYKNVETYVNEEYVKPIMFFINNGQINSAYEWLTSLANKYVEQNNYMLAYEKLLEERGGIPSFADFRKALQQVCGNEFGTSQIDFDTLESPFTSEEEEMRQRELALDADNCELELTLPYLTSDNLGTLVKDKRKEAGLSQQTLADRVGMSKTALNNIETNKSKASLDTVQRILAALGYSLECKKVI